MSDTTLEIAKRCPQCSQQGQFVTEKPAPDRGGSIHIFECPNTRCKDFGARWLVQVRPDGTIPQPGDRTTKLYPKLSNDQISAGMRQVENVLQRDLRDSEELR